MKYVFKNKLYLGLITIIDFLGNIFYFPFKLLREKPKNIKNILLIRLDHIGDFVSTTPLFENIKSNFNKARLTVVVNPAVFDLAKNNPYIDEIIAFRAPWFSRRSDKVNIADFFRLVKRIRQGKFDIGIEPRGDFFSIVLMFLGKIKYRVGFGITGGGFLLDREIKYNKDTHTIEKNLDVLRAINVPVKNNLTRIYFSEADKDFVENLLKGINYSGKKAVIIHPFAGSSAKEWGKEKFLQLIEKMQSDGYETFLIGAGEDECSYGTSYDLRGKLNLAQLTYLIKRIGFFIGLDSGPANIAASLNVPAIVICSGTNIAQNWIPNNSRVRFVFKNTECKPCELKICRYQKHDCMEQINVADVLEKIKELTN